MAPTAGCGVRAYAALAFAPISRRSLAGVMVATLGGVLLAGAHFTARGLIGDGWSSSGHWADPGR
jgi:hypothetical protein